jgi:acetyl esterase/lipase
MARLLLLCVFALPLSYVNAQPKIPDTIKQQPDIVYGKGGDVELKLDLYLPKTEAKKPLPVVVWIHGGGWQGGNKTSGVGRVVPFVESGDYAGVSVAYRLTNVTPWPGQIHDCKAAIRWIRANAKKYNLDPDRIGVFGSSAGGHLVSMLGTSGEVKDVEGDNGSSAQSSRVSCVINFCGPTDFLSFFEDNPTPEGAKGPVSKLLGGMPKEKPEIAKHASPTTYVTKDDAPFLHLHGTSDKTVPVKQAEILHEALKKAGVDSTFVKIDGGGHGFGGPEVNQRVKDFFDKHLLKKDVKVSGEAIKANPK